MNIVYADLWKMDSNFFPGMIVVTTNSTIKANGELVMGRGAAAQAKLKVHELPLECGKAIWGETRNRKPYGFLEVRPSNRPGRAGFGIFQVKHNYFDRASLDLIELACDRLGRWMHAHPTVHVRMNFPGIGNGGLPIDPVAQQLHRSFKDCDNLTVHLKAPAPDMPLCNWCGDVMAPVAEPCPSCTRLGA